MLTANTKSGKKISLGYHYKKETLLYLRSTEEFICPVCGEEVILKLGNVRIFHFAHKKDGTCPDFYENESYYHMEGKLQLYQWLIRQKIPAVLEYYDREIKQRPDIMFVHEGKKYALEYQCSPIPESIFMKRSRLYTENGYTPLWIIGRNRIGLKGRNILSLSEFDYFFLQRTTDGQFYLPSYCPEQKIFHFTGPIFSYSAKNAFSPDVSFLLSNMNVCSLLHPHLPNQLSINDWTRALEKYHLNWSLHHGAQQTAFLQEIYMQNLNPYLLPPEIGLPVRHSLLIQTSPVIWQTYFYLDILTKKQPQDVFRFQDIERCFNMRIGRKEIMIRNLPQFERLNPVEAVLDYLHQLEKAGVVSIAGKGIFQLEKRFLIPQSNREREEQKNSFYQKYFHTLSNP